ncbi:MAG: peptidylprolyl isomerase [Candidatus Omnitrophica bacterium]|jgi:peptidylprolyl isomerase|nr:peptidylprolyl isomerase [Candidatus Omnitrophota bacterium]MDD5078837.1 peptidylprolyl isomerase [Candidatus Omnitrophota bacterium]
MTLAKLGDKVKVHYTGKLEDGRIFDDSLKREPLEFKIGEKHLLEDFEQAVIGMKAGEWKTIKIPADRAYGQPRQEMFLALDRDQLPKDLKLSVGQQLQISQDENMPLIVTVNEIAETKVVVDANHPLAGKDLVFDITLQEILPGRSCCE